MTYGSHPGPHTVESLSKMAEEGSISAIKKSFLPQLQAV